MQPEHLSELEPTTSQLRKKFAKLKKGGRDHLVKRSCQLTFKYFLFIPLLGFWGETLCRFSWFVSRYCSKLPGDRFTHLNPVYNCKSHTDGFVCELEMPTNCQLRKTIVVSTESLIWFLTWLPLYFLTESCFDRMFRRIFLNRKSLTCLLFSFSLVWQTIWRALSTILVHFRQLKWCTFSDSGTCDWLQNSAHFSWVGRHTNAA